MTRPLSLAIIRRPLTANSRQMTISSPGGHLPDLHEPQHGGRHQHLVRQGVGKLAEVRHQVVLPGDLACRSRSVRLAMMKMARATYVAPGKPQYSTTMKAGINSMRKKRQFIGQIHGLPSGHSSTSSPVSSPSMAPVGDGHKGARESLVGVEPDAAVQWSGTRRSCGRSTSGPGRRSPRTAPPAPLPSERTRCKRR